MRSAMLRVPALATIAIAALPAGAAVELPKPVDCGPGGKVADAGNGWIASKPTFLKGPADVLLLAAPQFAPDRLYVSNGVMVLSSLDAGCSWFTILDLAEPVLDPPIPLPIPIENPLPGRVTALAAPSSATQANSVYVGVADGAGDLRQPRVFSSTDGGLTWHKEPSGLPPVGIVREIAASDQVPQTAYAVVDLGVDEDDPTRDVYRTTDGGVTFERRGEPGSAGGDDLVVHQRSVNTIFGRSGTGVVRSDDAGETFASAGLDGGDIADVDASAGQASIRLVAGHTAEAAVHRSDDGGGTWRRVAVPVVARNVAMAPLLDLVAVTDGENVHLQLDGGLSARITPQLAVPERLTVSAPTSAGFAVAGLGGGVVLRGIFGFDLRPAPPAAPGVPIRLLPSIDVKQFPATLLPDATEVELPAGGARTVPVRLLLPRTPLPVDVMFLVDTSGSMQPYINGLRKDLASIVNSLGQIGLDAKFGLADFRDYPPPHGSGHELDHPYRLGRVIGPSDSELATALGRLSAFGGGDGPESQLTALLQSTVGTGDVFVTADGAKIRYLPPGLRARYRPGSVRLAILVTDNGFHRGRAPKAGVTVGYPGPTFEDTVRILRRHGVHQLGLVAYRNQNQEANRTAYQNALRDVPAMAAATDTFAPAGGVDCDGDGRNDLTAGQPLVCSIAPDPSIALPIEEEAVELGPAVVALSEAQPNYATVGLATTARLVATVGPPRPRVDLKADNELDFTVRLTCPRAPAPSRHDVPLVARAGERSAATASLVLRCGPQPTTPEPGPIPPPPLDRTVVAPAPPPPAPPNPVTNVNSNPNPNPNLNPQAGMADQEQEEPQLAFATEDFGALDDEELAMTGLGTVLLTAGAAAAVRARSRARVARTRPGRTW